MPRLLATLGARWLRKERRETQQLEQLETGVFRAAAKHQLDQHQYAQQRRNASNILHVLFHLPLIRSSGWGHWPAQLHMKQCGKRTRTKTGYFQHSHKFYSGHCWADSTLQFLVFPPPSTENKPSLSSGGREKTKFLSCSMSTLISLSHKCEKYVATPVSWGLNTKTQRESI